jgi:hypothetical protein
MVAGRLLLFPAQLSTVCRQPFSTVVWARIDAYIWKQLPDMLTASLCLLSQANVVVQLSQPRSAAPLAMQWLLARTGPAGLHTMWGP